jgi:hypothetical protein
MAVPDFAIPSDHPASRDNREAERPSPIDAVADAMVARLKEKLPGKVAVDHFPDKPEEYDFEGSDAAALVIWDGSTFDQAGVTGEQGTREALRMGVALLVRSLRGPSGAYALKHEIQLALHGWSFAGTTGLRPVKADLERQGEGVFQYLLVFEGAIRAVPTRPAGVALPASARR